MKRRTSISILLAGMLLFLSIRCALVERSDGKELQPSSSAPAKTATQTVGSKLKQDEVQTMLRLHNKARKDVGVGPLVWSDKLAACAQEWADHLAATGCRMEHRPRSGKWKRIYGENLFMGTAGYYRVGDAVDAWVSEKKDFHGKTLNSSNWSDAGHYTQVVWRNTKEVGCAKKVCNGMVIVVCNYNPPGNVMGEKPY